MERKHQLQSIVQKWRNTKLAQKEAKIDWAAILEPLSYEIRSLVGWSGELPDTSSDIFQQFEGAVLESMNYCLYIGFELAEGAVGNHEAVSLVGEAVVPIETVGKNYFEHFCIAMVSSLENFPEEGPGREAMDWMSERLTRVVKTSVETGTNVMLKGVEHYHQHHKKGWRLW